ncbi:MAG: MarR family transcriptional regulator [Anaerolineae bacterium]|nr:MarR family transcriptional regulator [Anaerolineae bacterium]
MSPFVGSESLDFMLAQVCKLHRKRADALLETLGLYQGQPPVLFALWEQDGLTHRELAAWLHVQAATMTKMIQRMEKNGFVERRADPEDQRVSRVYLTEAGRTIRERMDQIWQILEAETFADFTLEERVLLRRFFLQIRGNLLHAAGNPRE